MPLFRYQAVSSSGKKMSGVIDADSYDLAKEKLLGKNVLLTKLYENDRKLKVPKLSGRELLRFTKEVAQFLRAGLPLYESLQSIEEKYQNDRSHSIYLDLCDHLKTGRNLSTVLKKYDTTFDPIYIAMVEAAEEGGELEEVFRELAILIERQQKLKKKLISASIYPAFLGTFAFFLLAALLLFVVPTMEELFQDRALHPVTQIVLNTSRFFVEKKYELLTLSICVGIAIFTLLKIAKYRTRLFQIIVKLPLIKTIVQQAAIVRFCHALSLLIKNGVSFLDALQLSKRAMNQPAMAEKLKKCDDEIGAGKSFSHSLAQSGAFPKLVTRMLATAEETGDLPGMLQNICSIYEEDLEKNISQITTFFQPIMLIVLGAVVALVLLAILLPLTDVSSFL